MRPWLIYALKYTFILAASVFVVGGVISRAWASALEAALFGASLGAAMATLQYRYDRVMPAASWRAVGWWLLSSAWGTPWLAASLAVDPTLLPGWPAWRVVALAAAIAAGMALVALLPLSWLQGKWGQHPPA